MFKFFKGYISKVNKIYKSYNHIYGDSPKLTISFYASNLEITSSRSSLKLDYSQLSKMIDTENLFILMAGISIAATVDKDNFTTGEFNDFLAFIQHKCEHLPWIVYAY